MILISTRDRLVKVPSEWLHIIQLAVLTLTVPPPLIGNPRRARRSSRVIDAYDLHIVSQEGRKNRKTAAHNAQRDFRKRPQVYRRKVARRIVGVGILDTVNQAHYAGNTSARGSASASRLVAMGLEFPDKKPRANTAMIPAFR